VDWCNLKGPDFEKNILVRFISRKNIKKAKIEKKPSLTYHGCGLEQMRMPEP
jgi:hypothetical protein